MGNISFSIDIRSPFDSKTPFGYFIACVLTYSLWMNLIYFTACTVSAGIGVYFFVTSCSKDIRNNLISFKGIAESIIRDDEILTDFFEIIQFHADLKKFRNFIK